MTFLASACSKTLLKLQKSQYQYQMQIIGFRVNTISREIESIESQYDSSDVNDRDLSQNSYYQQLRRLSETYETQQSGYEDQIALLDAEIKTFDDMTKNGIKSSCSLTLSGG